MEHGSMEDGLPCGNLLAFRRLSTRTEAGIGMGPETHNFALVKCARESLQIKQLFLLQKESGSLIELCLIFPMEIC